MFKVLVSEPLAEEGLRILRAEKKLEVVLEAKLSAEGLKRQLKGCHGLILRSQTKLTKEIIDAADSLKVIGRAGIGLDNVDVEAASKKGVIVMNSPGGNVASTAEHTMSMMLALSRNIPQAHASLKRGEWDRKRFMGVEICAKTLGVIGLGRIGTEVAKRASSFGMHPIAHDPFLSPEKAKEVGVELVQMKELLARSDYVTIHIPLTDETRHIISDAEFQSMKDGVRIINCARGGIVDEQALARAIESGKVAGAALDVFEKEPPEGSPLLKFDSVVTTPHLGASTEEAQVSVAIDIARQVADALLGRGIRNAVNLPTVEPEVYKVLEPYIRLGERMGALQAQLVEGAIEDVRIKYNGDIINHDLAPVTVAIIKGLLTPALGEAVNYVNATVLAKERGIGLLESKSARQEDFANLITLTVVTKTDKRQISGTIFFKSEPRIVKVDRYYVEVVPQGFLVLISNRDVPGIVGHIGTVFGKNKINIAGMTFGRERPGGKAVTVLNVDDFVPKEVLEQIEQIPDIWDAKLVSL